MKSNDRQIFQGLFLINFLITLGFGISDAFFPLYCQNIGLRGILMGAAVGGYALSKIIFSPIMGSLSDLLGRKTLLIMSLSLYLLISCAYLVIADPLAIVCLRLLQGAGCAMFRPVLQTAVADHTKPERRGTTTGTFDISFYAAISLGPLIGGIVMDQLGFQGLFSALTALSLVALCLGFYALPADNADRPAAPASTPFTPSRLWQMRPDDAMLRGLLLFILGRACGITACATFLPIMLTSRLGMNGLQTGGVMASATLAMTLLLRPSGKIADRVPRPSLVICGGIMVPFLYLLLALITDFNQALGISLGIGAFSAISQPAASSLLIEEGQRLGMGSTLGIFNAVLNIGFIVGPLVGSLFLSASGIQSVFVAIGVIGLLTIAGFIAVIFARPARAPLEILKNNY